jgi:lipoate-protein ligase B
MAHVFKALQIMEMKKKVSRSILVHELGLGEGSVKTLVKHFKMNGLIENSNAGMWLTNKGRGMYLKLFSVVPAETNIPKCSIALGKFNHAVLIRGLAYNVKTGIEQRDAAIKSGASGATTLVFRDDKLTMPGIIQESLRIEPEIFHLIMKKLRPEDKDVIIIVNAFDRKTSEMAAKSTALETIYDHEMHI